VALCNQAKRSKAVAKTEKKKARVNFEEMAKRHNAKIVSSSQDFDTMFRSYKIKKERCHGENAME